MGETSKIYRKKIINFIYKSSKGKQNIPRKQT